MLQSSTHMQRAGRWFFYICLFSVPTSTVWAEAVKDAYYYYQVGDWAKAVAGYDAAVVQNPAVDVLNKAAESHYYGGKLSQAEAYVKQALVLEDNLDSKVLMALIRARKGEVAQALKDLEILNVNAADENKIYTAKGMIASKEDESLALSFFQKAIEKKPDDFWAWFNIGLIYEEEEKFEAATKAYKNAVRINPLFAQAQNNLGYTYKERHFYAYAVEQYLRAIELRPDNAGYYYNVGNAYAHQEKIDKAFDAYKKAIELDPTFAKAHYNMARTFLRKDMVREAIDEFKLYLKYGNQTVFDYVAQKEAVEDEIMQLEEYIKSHGPGLPAGREGAH